MKLIRVNIHSSNNRYLFTLKCNSKTLALDIYMPTRIYTIRRRYFKIKLVIE